MTAENTLRFEGFTLDLDRLCLHGPVGRIELRRKSFDVLRYLVEHAGRVVPKEEMINTIWADVVVGDESLAQCISEVRRALQDKSQRIIKTVARRGYLIDVPIARNSGAPASQRFDSAEPFKGSEPDQPLVGSHPRLATAEVLLTDAPRTNAHSSSDATVNARAPFRLHASFAPTLDRRRRLLVSAVALIAALIIVGTVVWAGLRGVPSTTSTMMAAPTVAVLPFVMPGSDDGQRSLAASVEAEIRSELARAYRGFDLIIRSAPEGRELALGSKNAFADLVARYLVTGTTWADTMGQRASIQLIETDTKRQIWSESFDFHYGQKVAFNRTAARIARLVIIEIQAAESQLPLPATPEAGHYALLGWAAYDTERGRNTTFEAQSLFQKALALDVNSVPGLLGLASTKLLQIHNGWISAQQRPSALIEASDLIERLVKLDPRNAAGHQLRASLSRALGDTDKAIASLEYALLLNPNYFGVHAELARIKIDVGQARESFAHIEDALQLIPPESKVHYIYFFAGMAALHVGDDDSAVQWLLKARQANPAFEIASLWLAAAYLGVGEENAARASLANFLREHPNFTIAGSKRFTPVRNPTAAKQRERILDAWRRLGVPEDATTATTR
jgi:DNA-binding winged helix-turn-helix (wHTH) protein/TolB-like protein/Flp pilus assembly protein TadD